MSLDDNYGDKRRARRINRRFILRVAVFSKDPLTWSHVTIRNLSSTGILFTFDRPIEIGQVLAFKIEFPSRLVECMGRVVRVEQAAHGLFSNVAATFQGMNAEEAGFVEAFVETWKPES